MSAAENSWHPCPRSGAFSPWPLRGERPRCPPWFRSVAVLPLVHGTRAAQQVRHAVVALVAGVLVDLIVRPVQRNRRRPWLRPGGRVLGRELVVDRSGVGALEPL